MKLALAIITFIVLTTHNTVNAQTLYEDKVLIDSFPVEFDLVYEGAPYPISAIYLLRNDKLCSVIPINKDGRISFMFPAKWYPQHKEFTLKIKHAYSRRLDINLQLDESYIYTHGACGNYHTITIVDRSANPFERECKIITSYELEKAAY